MWTEQEKLIAKTLCEPDVYALLTKLFTHPNFDISEQEVSKNVVALDNEKYGELMKVAYMVKQDNLNRLKVLKTISATPSGRPIAIAPK
jgi:hypothetical protein